METLNSSSMVNCIDILVQSGGKTILIFPNSTTVLLLPRNSDHLLQPITSRSRTLEKDSEKMASSQNSRQCKTSGHF